VRNFNEHAWGISMSAIKGEMAALRVQDLDMLRRRVNIRQGRRVGAG
jgi:hypothetical protein